MNQPSDHRTIDKNDDEIDLAQLIRGLVQEKKRFLKNGLWALGIWVCAFIVYALVTFNPASTYSLILSLNFPQAAQSKYPNGSPFSPNDIVSNTVLERVWADNNLEKSGISLQRFQKSVNAIPFTGEINFIDAKYKGMLSTKNLTRADIERIEAEYRNEVAQASSKNIKLVLESKEDSYSLMQASKVLNDVATVWSKTAIEKLGASRSPILDSLTLDEQIKTESPLIVVNYLNDVVYKAQTLILQMQQDSNSNSYRDDKTGSNLAGLAKKLSQINNYQIDQLDAFVALNIKISDFEQLQTQYKIQELQEQRKVLLLKAESNQRALGDYTGSKNQGSAPGESRGRSGSSSDSGVQISGDAITKLFSLATESKDAEYRQRLTSERIALEGQANDLNIQISKLERRLSYGKNKSQIVSPETKKEYVALLDKTWGGLTGTMEAVTRIQVMAQKDFLGDSGLLYTLVSQPAAYSPGISQLLKAALVSLLGMAGLWLAFTFGQIVLRGALRRSES
jgi:hypothetical protein